MYKLTIKNGNDLKQKKPITNKTIENIITLQQQALVYMNNFFSINIFQAIRRLSKDDHEVIKESCVILNSFHN